MSMYLKQVNGSTKIKYGEEEIDFKAPWRRETMCNLVKAGYRD